jgi:hypothetical protein
MGSEPLFKQCPICGGAVNLRSNRETPYTVFQCSECGPFSLTNDLASDLAAGRVITPDSEVFRDWLKRESVIDSLKEQGPLITAGTFAKIRKSLN